MSIYVVDASVAAKWFLPEIHREAARSLRRQPHSLHAPDFLILEVGSIITTKIRRGEIDRFAGLRLLGLFRASPIQLHPWEEVYDQAVQLANETRRSLYDCLYLALALLLEGELVTADRKFYDAVQEHPSAHQVRWIEDLPG